MMNTRCTKLSIVRDDSKSSKTSNKKCPVVLHGDHIQLDLNFTCTRIKQEGCPEKSLNVVLQIG